MKPLCQGGFIWGKRRSVRRKENDPGLGTGSGWLDSLLNAAMILSGMGPVNQLQHDAGKWFASFYALCSGIAFITSIGVLIAPVAHRFLHKFHLDTDSKRG